MEGSRSSCGVITAVGVAWAKEVLKDTGCIELADCRSGASSTVPEADTAGVDDKLLMTSEDAAGLATVEVEGDAAFDNGVNDALVEGPGTTLITPAEETAEALVKGVDVTDIDTPGGSKGKFTIVELGTKSSSLGEGVAEALNEGAAGTTLTEADTPGGANASLLTKSACGRTLTEADNPGGANASLLTKSAGVIFPGISCAFELLDIVDIGAFDGSWMNCACSGTARARTKVNNAFISNTEV